MATVRTNRAKAHIDLGAIEHNVRQLKSLTPSQLMVVVKADGYGHGAVPVALAAKNAGADWLGVAFIDEALELRQHGVPGPILAWLVSSDDDIVEAWDCDIDISVGTLPDLERIMALAKKRTEAVPLHIEFDTGLSRAGISTRDAARAFQLIADNHSFVRLGSVWSHLACADNPESRVNQEQLMTFQSLLEQAAAAGLQPQLRHLANSAAALSFPAAHFDLVRVGIAAYGVSAGDALLASDHDLKPAMKLTARVSQIREIQPGDGVSYSHRWIAEKPTTVGLIPLGYADGVPRAASNQGHVTFAGQQLPILGTVCMDQFLVDCTGLDIAIGDEVTIFGAGASDAHSWALSTGSIGYELVTRIGSRIQREYSDGVS